uniref:Extensin-like n=1 Tax=Cicer arietinum TaxID=3827 RepID=A0A1S2XJE7_CICAR|nr:putative uncharacterized protein DDB_G0290521 [Cicer arietinum]
MLSLSSFPMLNCLIQPIPRVARTKTRAHKNPTSPLQSSSSSPPVRSPSPAHSPSPPPRPTPPHSSSEKTFSDYLSSSPEPCPQPLSTKLPPLYQCLTPSVSQCPPHLCTTMNPSSNTSSSQRRYMRILAGVGISKNKKVDNTIYIISDDEPSSPQHNSNPQTAPTPQPTTPLPHIIQNPHKCQTLYHRLQNLLPNTIQPKTQPQNRNQGNLNPNLPPHYPSFWPPKNFKSLKKSQKRPPQERSSPPQEQSSPPQE